MSIYGKSFSFLTSISGIIYLLYITPRLANVYFKDKNRHKIECQIHLFYMKIMFIWQIKRDVNEMF